MSSLLNALYLCVVGQGCKAALLQAARESSEAAFLYRVWDAIPDKKNFAFGYLRLERGDFSPKDFKPKSPYDHYILALFYERSGKAEKAAKEYYEVCRRTDGLFAAESCYRAYRLGVEEAKRVMKERFSSTYYMYFLSEDDR
ncbi:MAG: hypothetical protein GXO29_05285 [Thermotogae bacterium]|nr:hypothetical protein [Thermotogota bacterium]